MTCAKGTWVNLLVHMYTSPARMDTISTGVGAPRANGCLNEIPTRGAEGDLLFDLGNRTGSEILVVIFQDQV